MKKKRPEFWWIVQTLGLTHLGNVKTTKPSTGPFDPEDIVVGYTESRYTGTYNYFPYSNWGQCGICGQSGPTPKRKGSGPGECSMPRNSKRKLQMQHLHFHGLGSITHIEYMEFDYILTDVECFVLCCFVCAMQLPKIHRLFSECRYLIRKIESVNWKKVKDYEKLKERATATTNHTHHPRSAAFVITDLPRSDQ